MKERSGLNMERKLASIRVVDNVISIPNADLLECYVVGGWNVVDTKNKNKIS